MIGIFLKHYFASDNLINDEKAKISFAQDFMNASLIEFNFQCKVEKVNNE